MREIIKNICETDKEKVKRLEQEKSILENALLEMAKVQSQEIEERKILEVAIIELASMLGGE